MQQFTAESFEHWREIARRLVQAAVPPEQIHWVDGRSPADRRQGDLFATEPPANPRSSSPASLPATKPSTAIRVPASFLALARTVAHHRSRTRWSLLYRLLWRLQHEPRHLLNIASDPDVIEVTRMEKAVRRDAHKMKAFVRFRKVTDADGEHYVAWHRPDHYTLRYTSDFFARRFDVMRWTIMTPDESVTWDGAELAFGPGMPRSAAPDRDELESLWKTYYAHIFNPARIKLKAMQAEMPKKHWATMPETELIGPMLRDAPARVERMIRETAQRATAQEFLPHPGSGRGLPSLDELRAAAASCRGCQLCEAATQTVFGSGPADAPLVFVGEQPGDQEDLAGEPFVGPAGQLLNQMFERAGLDRSSVYLTNAVKHFKFTHNGTRRLHKKPSSREIAACRPWLEAELARIRPQRIVCLGATAAAAVLGPNFPFSRRRGEWIASESNAPEETAWVLATHHPAAILRASGGEKMRLREAMEADLRKAIAAR